jgi:hypothetical protein
MSSMYGICQGIITSQDNDFVLSAAGCLKLFTSPFSSCAKLILAYKTTKLFNVMESCGPVQAFTEIALPLRMEFNLHSNGL